MENFVEFSDLSFFLKFSDQKALNDQQPVNIFRSLVFFTDSSERKEPIQKHVMFSPIQKNFIDLKTNAWSMVGSENETMICDTEDVSHVLEDWKKFNSRESPRSTSFALGSLSRDPHVSPDKSCSLHALFTSSTLSYIICYSHTFYKTMEDEICEIQRTL